MGKPTFDNHPSLYLADGNIALVAPRSANEFVVFRVHRSILAKVSIVFEDMFSIPNGHLVEEYDGVPLVYMTDSADELENLLKMMYFEVYIITLMSLLSQTYISLKVSSFQAIRSTYSEFGKAYSVAGQQILYG